MLGFFIFKAQILGFRYVFEFPDFKLPAYAFEVSRELENLLSKFLKVAH